MVLSGLAQAEWHRYLVDNTTENTGTCVQVLDRAPYIAYYSNAGLKLACWAASGWEAETLDTRTSIHNGNPSLVFDSQGNPHIAYFCGTPWYTYWTGTNWEKEQIDTDTAGDFISLCLDSDERPHVAYNKWRGLIRSMLKYAYQDSTGWHPELIDSLGGADCVLRFDTSGRPCIGHCASYIGHALYYSYRTADSWVKDTILRERDDASQCYLALDDNGNPHISYYWAFAGDYDLRYVDRDADTWRIDVVDHGTQTSRRGTDNCMVQDEQGTYHISYHAHNECQVRYAHGSFGNWQVEIVDTVGMYDCRTSIALDRDGYAYIAYCDEVEDGALYLSVQQDLTGVREEQTRVVTTIYVRCRFFRSGPELLRFLGDARYRVRDPIGRLVASSENPISAVLGTGVYFVATQTETGPALFKAVLTH